MTHPAARLVLLLGLAALAAAGCRDNTTCTPGTVLCTLADGTDFNGDPFKGGGDELRVCSTTGDGADADGEFIVQQDCAKDDTVCFEDVGRDDDTHKFDGCITAACGQSAASPCVKEGATSCLLTTASICAKDANGCLSWTLQEDCADSGHNCAYQADVATCQ